MGLRNAFVRARSSPALIGLCAALCLAGCATIEHSLSTSEVAGRTLPTRGALGAERLRAEIEVDVTLRDFVARYGRPDYLHVVDRMNLYFFYVADDMAAKFERDLLPPSEARKLGRIPGSLIDLLPKREVDALLARRARVKGQQQAAARKIRKRTAARSPAPAARAPAGYSLNTFNVRTVVERLRPPITAADPGVGGWRTVAFSDGVSGRVAQNAGIRYEVRTDRIAVAMSIASTRTSPPAHARLEVLRLNSAVFGAHADAITQQVMPWMQRVASDRSGRTPLAQRIRGRLVRVDRVPADGTLVYSIRP